MATQLSTINLALAHLSEPVVTDLGGDPKPPNVVKALAQWDQAMDVAQSRAGWLCCLDSRVLEIDGAGAIAADPNWRYSGRFTCPAGTLRIWAVDGEGFDWQAATAVDTNGAVRRVIRANHTGPLYADLLMRRPVEALTPLLADAMAWELAARLAGPIQSSEAKAKWAAGMADTAYERAASSEATELGGQAVQVPAGPIAAGRASAW